MAPKKNRNAFFPFTMYTAMDMKTGKVLSVSYFICRFFSSSFCTFFVFSTSPKWIVYDGTMNNQTEFFSFAMAID